MRNKTLIEVLEEADRAASLESCGINEVHQQAMKLYIDTWIRGPLQDAIGYLKGDVTVHQMAEWVRYR